MCACAPRSRTCMHVHTCTHGVQGMLAPVGSVRVVGTPDHVYTHVYDTCLYTCLHTSIHTSIHMSTHMPAHMSTCMPIHTPTHMPLHRSVHMCVHMSVHMCVHMSVHMSVHTCLHTELRRRAFNIRPSCELHASLKITKLFEVAVRSFFLPNKIQQEPPGCRAVVSREHKVCLAAR